MKKDNYYIEAYDQYGQLIHDVYNFKGEIIDLNKYINKDGRLLWTEGEEYLYSIDRKPVCELKTNATDVELSFTINMNHYINKISAPEAEKLIVVGCKNLTTLTCPKAILVDCNYTDKLDSIKAPNVISLNLNHCKGNTFHITDQKFPNLEKLSIQYSELQGGKIEFLSDNLKDVYINESVFQSIKTPNLSGSVTLREAYCMNETLNVPNAESVYLEKTSFDNLIADNAKTIDIRLCEYLDNLFANKAETVKIDQPDKFKNLVIPSHTEVEQTEEEIHKQHKL